MHRLGVPREGLVDARVRARTVAAVRRDLWLGALAGFHADRGAASAVHEGGASPAVVAPILVFGGSHDPVATADKEPSPKIVGLDPAERVIIPGAHLFLSEVEGRAALCGHLTTRLRRLLDQPR